MLLLSVSGCGTTRWSDTQRTATEQLLLSTAIDRAVSQLDFQPFSGRRVYLHTEYIDDGPHRRYLISLLRQYLLRHGCLLCDERDAADFVLEANTGAVGTDRHDMLIGVPEMSLPVAVPGVPSQIPEVPLIKQTRQKGVVKISVYGYHRETGHRVWQSPLVVADSTASNLWTFGAGPFQKDSARKGTRLAGSRLSLLIEAEENERVRDTFQPAYWPLPDEDIVPTELLLEGAGHSRLE